MNKLLSVVSEFAGHLFSSRPFSHFARYKHSGGSQPAPPLTALIIASNGNLSPKSRISSLTQEWTKTDMTRITRGLVIAEPWIDYILEGQKQWEMRSTSTKHRGPFALIRKGSGTVVGVASLTDVGPPQSQAQMLNTIDKHRIPGDMIEGGVVAKWCVPWKLTDVHNLAHPVPYEHKHGAVTWVQLEKHVGEAIAQALQVPIEPSPVTRETTTVAVSDNLRTTPGAYEPDTSPLETFIGETRLTEGNIRNSHFYLRPFFGKFPADVVGGSNKSERAPRTLTVDWGCGTPVETDLDGSKQFFRARAWIRKFFEQHEAAAGDIITVWRTAPYAYRITLQRNREKSLTS